jgi:hypothetical protein
MQLLGKSGLVSRHGGPARFKRLTSLEETAIAQD